MTFLTALAKVLPVFLLILLGVALRRLGVIRPETVADLKKLVVTVTLPAVLFLAFSQVAIEARYLAFVVIMFGACWLVLVLGRRLGPPLRLPSPFMPSLLTGFEAGMMGYAIFGAVYGQESIYKFGIIDLGQVFFVFFVLVPGLHRLTTGGQSSRDTVLGFLKTPVILAILAGLVFKQLGLPEGVAQSPLAGGVLEAIRMIGAMTTPLVALAIGYELQFRPGDLGRPLRTVGVRLLIWVPIGLALSSLVIGRLLGLDPVFQAAMLTMVLLPPPFVIPIFMRQDSGQDATYVVNTLTLATLVTLFAYAVVPLLYSPGG
jgi:hypothetical protein